ncbi:probable serine/threonine-protein kinase PBL25 [Hibiscus syriacus]|nr:probable serine/threonine-protein kinase PBL25 [Hibiscus syriacus]
MNCFPCFSSQKKEGGSKKDHDVSHVEQLQLQQQSVLENKEAPTTVPADYDNNSSIKAFNFRELASATKNFRQECLLGEGSLGKVYKGTIPATGQEVAVKQLDRNAMEGGNEFFVEVGQLSLLQHPNLVGLVGYCADGDQRLLVYEFMPGGSLEDHLHGGGKPLDWVTRMKIAQGTAQGLQYLHEKAKPPIIYRDLKSSKVLLDDEFNPKLSNIGIDKLGSSSDSKMPMQSKMMDNNGYNAPECMQSGTVNAQTDVYSFGVVLLELISGRKALDPSKPEDEKNLVAWAQPIFKEPKNFPQMADPSLNKKFPERGLNQAVAMAAMCVQEEAATRPLISDLSSVLSFLSMATEANNIPEDLPPAISGKLRSMSRDGGSSDDNDEDKETDNESESDDASADGNDDRSLSHKSSGRSLSSFGSRSGRDRSLSHKKSSKSVNYSTYGSDASESNSEGDEGSASSSNEKANEHSEDDDSSNEKADERRNDSMKSNSSAKKTRKKEKTSKGSKSSRKKKKPKDEDDSSHHRSSSTKKGRRKAKDDDDDNEDGSHGGSQPEN